MNKTTLFATALFSVCLSVSAHAAEIQVLVTAEHAGPDIIFHYTLVNNGQGKMMEFAIGARPANSYRADKGYRADNAVGNVMGTLTQLPTGTTYGPDPKGYQDIGHVANPANLTSPAMPVGWSAWISGSRDSENFAITWDAPKPVYGGPVNITGADAGQTLSGFSVRVPKIPSIVQYVPSTEPWPVGADPAFVARIEASLASKPVRVGSLEPYTTGEFEVIVWMGDSYLTHYATKRQIFGRIEKQDVLPPTLSVTLTPSTMRSGTKLLWVSTAITVTDNYDPASEIKLETITANQVLKSTDISGATFGTDDRSFQLKPVAGRVYTVTYSATDGSGNKATASATVTVKK